MSNSPALTDRLLSHRRLRMPLAVSGAAVLGLSMLLSVGPVLGAANNGNGNGSNGNGSNGNGSSTGTHGTSGNVKVHDVGTGVETSGTDNEPHVCSFWLGFEFDAPYEAGTWVVVSWAPTGDGSTVASGVYNTAGDGVDSSGVVEVSAGHYRVEWAATGATSSKKKTFWVDADCGQAAPTPDEVTPPNDVTPPTDAPGSPDEESQPEELPPPADASGSPDEVAPPDDVTPPTDAPGSPDEESQPEELVLSGQGSAPEDDGAPADEAPATDDEAPASDDEAPASDDEDVAPVDEPASEDITSPEDDSTGQDPADTNEEAPAGDTEATDPGSPPAQDELGSMGSPEGPTMSDTATPQTPVQGGALATLGLLLLIGAHAATRRERLIPATHN